MASLVAALDAALTDRYGTAIAEPVSPASTARGLRTRIAHLTKELGTASKAAAAIGISFRQLQRWVSKTKPAKPTPASLRKLEKTYAQKVTEPRLKRSLRRRKPPTSVRVTAIIRWSNSPRTMYNGGRPDAAGAHRTTTLTGLRMGGVIDTWVNLGPQAAAQAFEHMVAQVYSAREIRFEGDDVSVEFP